MNRGEWIALSVAGLGLGGIVLFAVTRMKSGKTPAAPGAPPAPTSTPDEIEALARAIQSEAGGSSRLIQTAVGFAVLNESIRRSDTIWHLVRGDSDSWGSQHERGGYVASSKAPTATTRELARQILAGDIADPTGGATQFDVPKLSRSLHEKNPDKFPSPEEVARRRRANGSTLALLPGVPEETFRMWRPRGVA